MKSESAKGEAKSSKESSSDDKTHSDSKADKHDSKATKGMLTIALDINSDGFHYIVYI